MGARWCLGPAPDKLDAASIETIRQLFLDQTGERYYEGSVRSLPIPEWGGNLLLLDDNGLIRGVFWTAKFSDTRARVVAFAIDESFKGQGFGSEAWEIFQATCRTTGHVEVQLEVRADNEFAIEFYRRRGLEVIGKLEGYYQSGLGYVMRGPIDAII